MAVAVLQTMKRPASMDCRQAFLKDCEVLRYLAQHRPEKDVKWNTDGFKDTEALQLQPEGRRVGSSTEELDQGPEVSALWLEP